MEKYDVAVIGMGPAGMSVSSLAHAAGLKVLAVENHKIGGECLNYGCMPSKSLLKVAEINETIKNIGQFGLETDGNVEIKDVFGIIRKKIEDAGTNKAVKMLEGIDTLINKGNAEFTDPHTIKVGGSSYRYDTVFICTGSKPFIPDIEGIENISFLTNRNLFELNNVPKTLTIIGGGAIACEMSQSFSRLGSKVNIINMDSHLIPAADSDVSDVLESRFKKENIGIYNSTTAYRVVQNGSSIDVYAGNHIFTSKQILIAAGRQPSLKTLNLDKIGVKHTKKGITVDEFNRTNIEHIYAVGDCNGKFTFSHAAMHQGMLSVMHLLKMKQKNALSRDEYPVPWAIFTEPEIAHTGMSEKEALRNGLKYLIVKDYYKNYGRAMVDGKSEGFIKIITDKKGKIYGVSIIGNGAGELINEWTMAIQNNIGVDHIAMMQHPFPTLSLMNSRVAQKWMMQVMQLNMHTDEKMAETA